MLLLVSVVWLPPVLILKGREANSRVGVVKLPTLEVLQRLSLLQDVTW